MTLTPKLVVPVQQSDATLTQANPVSGTQYEVLATTKNVRIIGMNVVVTWTVQPTPLELHVIIDGKTITFTFTNPVSAQIYTAGNDASKAESAQILTTTANVFLMPAFLREGRSVRVVAETTGGTVQNLEARVKFTKW